MQTLVIRIGLALRLNLLRIIQIYLALEITGYLIKYSTVLIIIQRDATQTSLFIILQVRSTCFGCQPHPSSAVHKTVTTTSGTGHIFLCSYLPPT